MDTCDVLVVGGGLAGLSCATTLAREGLVVHLVDQKRSLGERVHTTGIFVRRTLEDFHLPADCLGPAIRDVVLHAPSGRSIELCSRHDEFRVGRMADLYLHMLERAHSLGAVVRTGLRLRGHRPSRHGSTVELQAAGGGEVQQIDARFVIGADGARSAVARSFGLDRNQSFLVGAEHVYASRGACSRPTMHCFVDPELAPGYLAWLVDDGDEVHIGVAGHGPGYRARPALERFSERIAGRPAVGPLRETRGGLIPIGGLLPRIASGRALLVGDAAGAVSPLTAGGLDPCLRQARFASQVTCAWLSSGNRAALAAYQSSRLRRRFAARMLMRRGMDTLRNRWLIELAMAAMSRGPGKQLADRVFFGRGSFPDTDLLATELAERPGLTGRARAWLARDRESASGLAP